MGWQLSLLLAHDVFYRLVCLGLVDAQTFQHPEELLGVQAQNFFFASVPLVFLTLQPLVQQDESVRILIQSLESGLLVCHKTGTRRWQRGKGV